MVLSPRPALDHGALAPDASLPCLRPQLMTCQKMTPPVIAIWYAQPTRPIQDHGMHHTSYLALHLSLESSLSLSSIIASRDLSIFDLPLSGQGQASRSRDGRSRESSKWAQVSRIKSKIECKMLPRQDQIAPPQANIYMLTVT